MRSSNLFVASWFVCLLAVSSMAAEPTALAPQDDSGAEKLTTQEQTAGDPEWLTDYSEAMRRATDEQKMLLVYFHDDQANAAHKKFQSKTLADPGVRRRLSQYVCLRLPMSATVEGADDSQRLLDHKSFHYMYGRGGVAVVDLAHVDASYYGYVVSCFPFDRPAYYCDNYEGVPSVKTILSLPPGTITQRTMIYAVRMHPERPASTTGDQIPVLQSEASQHSQHQARIRFQGHHGWNSRAQRIWGRLRGGSPPSEVCAESWPGPGLVTACIDCVHSWRQSSGHWSAVRSRQPGFGYDIRRGSNGIWYATGIFGG